MFWHSSFRKQLSIFVVPALLLIGRGSMQADPLSVKSVVTPSGGNWAYTFGITDLTSTDPWGELVSVDFTLPAGNLVGTPMAPAGNEATFDPSGNVVKFASDNQTGFPLTTVNGFWFVTSMPFTSFSYTAYYLNHAETMASTFDGTVQPQAVPEPATMGLFAAASLLLLSKFRRSRRA